MAGEVIANTSNCLYCACSTGHWVHWLSTRLHYDGIAQELTAVMPLWASRLMQCYQTLPQGGSGEWDYGTSMRQTVYSKNHALWMKHDYMHLHLFAGAGFACVARWIWKLLSSSLGSLSSGRGIRSAMALNSSCTFSPVFALVSKKMAPFWSANVCPSDVGTYININKSAKCSQLRQHKGKWFLSETHRTTLLLNNVGCSDILTHKMFFDVL